MYSGIKVSRHFRGIVAPGDSAAERKRKKHGKNTLRYQKDKQEKRRLVRKANVYDKTEAQRKTRNAEAKSQTVA